MGDFHRIRNVANFSTKLGQSFSSSTETLSVERNEVEIIPDIENEKGYLFYDGIGKLSTEFARKVASNATNNVQYHRHSKSDMVATKLLQLIQHHQRSYL